MSAASKPITTSGKHATPLGLGIHQAGIPRRQEANGSDDIHRDAVPAKPMVGGLWGILRGPALRACAEARASVPRA